MEAEGRDDDEVGGLEVVLFAFDESDSFNFFFDRERRRRWRGFWFTWNDFYIVSVFSSASFRELKRCAMYSWHLSKISLLCFSDSRFC